MSNKKKLAHFVGDPICERLLTQKTSLCLQEKSMRFLARPAECCLSSFRETAPSRFLPHREAFEIRNFTTASVRTLAGACVKVANEALQIHGGYGYTKDFPVEKFYRDSKLCTIGEGTSEIQKLVISREILR